MQVKGQKVVAARILQAASKFFAEKGYDNVSIRDICRETETTAPVIYYPIYYPFRSKKGLFDAVAREQISMADFISRLTEVAGSATPYFSVSA